MDNNGQHWITMDNNEQHGTTMENNGQQWTTIGNNGQQWIRIDNININIRGATCISDAVLQQQQKGPRQVISFHKQN